MKRSIMGFPLPTGPLQSGLWAIRDLFVNLFVLASENGLICIDAGWRPRTVALGFRELGLSPDLVTTVLLTHSDVDHAGGLPLFGKAVVFAGHGEIDLVNGKHARTVGIFYNRSPQRPWRWVQGGDHINLGDKTFDVVAAEGHTPGSVGYLTAHGWLFAGDAVWRCCGIRTLPFFLNLDNNLAKNTLHRLLATPGLRRIVTAHSGFLNPREAIYDVVNQS